MYHLIDPPVDSYSSVSDIQGWIDELKTMDSTPEVMAAITEADGWLVVANKIEELTPIGMTRHQARVAAAIELGQNVRDQIDPDEADPTRK